MLAAITEQFYQNLPVTNLDVPREPPKFSSASPCPTCLSPIFWIDVYGGGPHCATCTPWPIPAAVKLRLAVVVTPDGFGFERLERTRSMPDKLDVASRVRNAEARQGDAIDLDDSGGQSGWFDRWWGRLGDPALIEAATTAAKAWNAGARQAAKDRERVAADRQAKREAKKREAESGVTT